MYELVTYIKSCMLMEDFCSHDMCLPMMNIRTIYMFGIFSQHLLLFYSLYLPNPNPNPNPNLSPNLSFSNSKSS